MPDDFPSMERPGQRIRVDATGKLAEPIVLALARGHVSQADTLFRDLPSSHREVLSYVRHYFAWTPTDIPTPKRKRKTK